LKYVGSDHDMLWYLPVLGQYKEDLLDPEDYPTTYTIEGGSPVTTSVFASPAQYERVEINEKGVEVVTPMAEAVIRLIDGASGSDYVFINDPGRLKVLVAQWNSWLTTSGVQSFSHPTVTLSSELGINALCSISCSRSWITRGPGSIRERENKSLTRTKSKRQITGVRDKRETKIINRAMFNSVYSTREAISDISQGEFLDAPYNQVLQTWILPQFEDELIANGNSTILQRWQFMMDETHLVTRTLQQTATTMSALHDSYASKMTKSKLSQKDDWTVFFDEMAQQGRGGILSGIVAGIVGEAFPAVKGIASKIASALPI